MKYSFKTLLIICFLGFACFSKNSFAAFEVGLGEGEFNPIPITIVPFQSDDSEMANNITSVIANDLQGSGLFKLVTPNPIPQSTADVNTAPQPALWKSLNIQGLVHGTVKSEGFGRIRIEFRLWDVFTGEQLVGVAFGNIDKDNWRPNAHKVSDAIYKAFIGEEGYFNTRVAFVTEVGNIQKPTRRLTIMDQDGANLQMLTDGKKEVHTPRFSPTNKEIIYMSYNNKNQTVVYRYNLETKREEQLEKVESANFSPRYSPDGQDVVFSKLTHDGGNTDIFILNLPSGKLTRLTDHPSDDTSPCFSPDGQQIVFESARGGNQQIYVMSRHGGEPTRISFGSGKYAAPVWAPKGDYIAFIRLYGGKFYLGVMRSNGSDERLLAQGFELESPSWAPNGRALVYYKRTAQDGKGDYLSKLFAIDISGKFERQIKTNGNAGQPTWSARMQ